MLFRSKTAPEVSMSFTITPARQAILVAVRDGAFHRDGSRGPWYLSSNGDKVTGPQTRALNDLTHEGLVFTQRMDQGNRFNSARVAHLTELGQRALDLLDA
jgi:hypothetical protein